MNEREEARTGFAAALKVLVERPQFAAMHADYAAFAAMRLIRAVMAEGQGGAKPGVGEMVGLRDRVRRQRRQITDLLAAKAVAEAQIAAVREAAGPLLRGDSITFGHIRNLRAALAASPDNAKQEGGEANSRVETRPELDKSPPISEPAAQGRAFKVGDRVRDLAHVEGVISRIRRDGDAYVVWDNGHIGWSKLEWLSLVKPLAPSLTGELVKALRRARHWVRGTHSVAFRQQIDALLTRAEKENQL